MVTTKVSSHPQFPGLSAANIAAEASLTRLGTDYIDLYYAHNDDPDTPIAQTAAAFDALVRADKIRAIGVSNYSGARIREWFQVARRDGLALPVAVQPFYNLISRDPYEHDIVPVAAEEDPAVMPYFALASGFLTGKYRTAVGIDTAQRASFVKGYLSQRNLAVLAQIADSRNVSPATIALAWLRSHPHVTAPVASARTVDQLPALLASATLDLAPDELTLLTTVSAA